MVFISRVGCSLISCWASLALSATLSALSRGGLHFAGRWSPQKGLEPESVEKISSILCVFSVQWSHSVAYKVSLAYSVVRARRRTARRVQTMRAEATELGLLERRHNDQRRRRQQSWLVRLFYEEKRRRWCCCCCCSCRLLRSLYLLYSLNFAFVATNHPKG